MGRIVIPRPRLERRGYQPKYRRQQTLDRRHKFGPDDIKLLMKVLDTAVAVGGKVAGAVGRTQTGPQAAEAQKLADARQKKVGAAIAQQEATLGGPLSAEQRDQVRRTVIGREGAVRSAAAAEGAEADVPPHVQAFSKYVEDIDEPAEYAHDPSVWGPSPRTGRSPIPGGRPPTPSPETVDDENLFAAGFNRGTAIREGIERARQEALRARQRGPVVGGPPMFAPVPRGAADQTARHVPPPQQAVTAPAPPAAADPPAPAARPAQVEVLVDQAVMMPPGQVHAPLANDSLMTAQALVAAAQANREAMWPSVAELQRMDVGALQALGAYADTPQKRTQIMQAIRDSPDVQPTSVSDLLGMGEDHVRRAQKKALTIMKGSSKRGGLGLKDTVDLAKSMYGLRVQGRQEQRTSELHPGKVTLQQQAIEAGRRKALLEAQTQADRMAKIRADAEKARTLADKAARDFRKDQERDARRSRGAVYKKQTREADEKFDKQRSAWVRNESLRNGGKTPTEGQLAEAGEFRGKSNPEALNMWNERYKNRRNYSKWRPGASAVHAKLTPPKPPSRKLKIDAEKNREKLRVAQAQWKLAQRLKGKERAESKLPPDEILVERLIGLAKVQKELDAQVEAQGAPARTQQKDAPIDVKSMTDEELEAMAAGR